MKMDFDITKITEEIVMQAKENQEEFIFETIRPYCENILQMKINKEELKQILLNSMQKQQPCDDCISRAKALEMLGDEPENWTDTEKEIQELNDYRWFKSILEDLPSVTPQPKVGKWIDTGSGQECSECGEIQYGYDSFRKYCPNCGAKMEVEE